MPTARPPAERRGRRHLAAAAAVALGALALAGCGGNSNGSVVVLRSPPTTVPSLTLSSLPTPFGRILTTGSGQTLYAFALDSSTHSACTSSSCTFVWPPLLVDGPVRLGPGLDQALVGSLARPDGRRQLTYAGHPLYAYDADTGAGVVRGQTLVQSGGAWYVLTPSGHELTTPFQVAP